MTRIWNPLFYRFVLQNHIICNNLPLHNPDRDNFLIKTIERCKEYLKENLRLFRLQNARKLDSKFSIGEQLRL